MSEALEFAAQVGREIKKNREMKQEAMSLLQMAREQLLAADPAKREVVLLVSLHREAVLWLLEQLVEEQVATRRLLYMEKLPSGAWRLIALAPEQAPQPPRRGWLNMLAAAGFVAMTVGLIMR